MSKQRKAYQIRTQAHEGAYSKAAGRKLYSLQRARRIVRFLKARGVIALAAPMMIDASARIAARPTPPASAGIPMTELLTVFLLGTGCAQLIAAPYIFHWGGARLY